MRLPNCVHFLYVIFLSSNYVVWATHQNDSNVSSEKGIEKESPHPHENHHYKTILSSLPEKVAAKCVNTLQFVDSIALASSFSSAQSSDEDSIPFVPEQKNLLDLEHIRLSYADYLECKVEELLKNPPNGLKIIVIEDIPSSNTLSLNPPTQTSNPTSSSLVSPTLSLSKSASSSSLMESRRASRERIKIKSQEAKIKLDSVWENMYHIYKVLRGSYHLQSLEFVNLVDEHGFSIFHIAVMRGDVAFINEVFQSYQNLNLQSKCDKNWLKPIDLALVYQSFLMEVPIDFILEDISKQNDYFKARNPFYFLEPYHLTRPFNQEEKDERIRNLKEIVLLFALHENDLNLYSIEVGLHRYSTNNAIMAVYTRNLEYFKMLAEKNGLADLFSFGDKENRNMVSEMIKLRLYEFLDYILSLPQLPKMLLEPSKSLALIGEEDESEDDDNHVVFVNTEPVKVALEYGEFEMAKQLIKKGFYFNLNQIFVFVLTKIESQYEIIQFLIDNNYLSDQHLSELDKDFNLAEVAKLIDSHLQRTQELPKDDGGASTHFFYVLLHPDDEAGQQIISILKKLLHIIRVYMMKT